MEQDSGAPYPDNLEQAADQQSDKPISLTRRRFSQIATVLVASLTLPAASTALAAVASVKGVRLWRSPEKTRLVFDMSSGVEHKVFPLSNPPKVVIDLENTRLPSSLDGLKLGDTPIKGIRKAVRNKTGVRIVLDLKKDVNPRSFVLKPNATYGHRLVVDLVDKAVAATQTRKPEPVNKNRDVIIAIDAGHGGEDPGAVGHRGAREKDVVLAISREVAALFEKSSGFKPVLVRTGDYYISLRERTRIARRKNADVFISIHADAFNRTAANGSSVFTLSERGASSEEARWLANKENNSDLIGGEDGISLGDKDDVLASVLLDLSMTDSQSRSQRIGSQVLGQLGRVNRLHKKKVEQAAFAVLKNPDIPSLLIETGFITNPTEASKLVTKAHQRKLARAIHSGVRDFFLKNPPAGTLIASNRSSSGAGSSYKVKSGDTLSGIASRHNVSLSRLLSHNSLSTRDTLRVGQVIRIP
ncbi:N-acetylmuramoyl-L-alanine amidase [Parendozoicomonas haliclonae]|uniref:N-acetylmuramoyl-L-alanine amidase AmiC n=1 Tax=Parendozoicomonas haliclonae TaxID=1960125 RepID=A0A1X7ATX6_9GAMM|nr:N-acetylmuramoyl-L-alanine amidase [Parendozoicomonas haliclonae]SMA50877.1 N-acetylmuramoyl-L-alanine amidase AmiC precursor [Parendozoicomonas haliclonae]